MNNALLKALGVESLPPGQNEYDIVSKILRDSEVNRIAHDLMTRQFALTVVQGMLPNAKAALRQKYGLDAAPTVARVRWSVGRGEINGQWFVKATGGSQETFFHGTPEKARTFTFQGEICPADIVQEYAQVYVWVGGGQDDVVLGQANQQPPQVHAPIEGPRR